MKKKILSLLLSATLIFSMFSLTAFAQETTKAQTWIENHAHEIHFKTISNFDNSENVYEFYVKNDKMLIKNAPMENFINLDVLYDGESYYIYPSKFPFLHFMITDGTGYNPAQDIIPTSLDGYYFIKSYTKTINSKEYYVEAFNDFEEYNGYSSLIEFIFEDDELKFIASDDDFDSRIEIISTQVDDSVFEPPFFSINLTAIFTIISRFFGFGII